MFIIFGDGRGFVRAEDIGERYCFECCCKQPFSLMVRYDYGHVYYIFGWVRRITYFFGCDQCHALRKVATTDADALIKKRIRIPLMKRYGCLTALALMALCFGIIFLGLPK